MSERLLLTSARTYRNQAFAAAAQKLGLEVVLGLDVPPPFLPRMPNCLALDYRDHDRALKTIRQYATQNPVRALRGVDDSGVVLAARAAALGLPHNAPDTAEAASNKRLMRQRFAAAGVRSPRFHASRLTDDPEDVIEMIGEKGIGFPCVLKPTRLSASKGVMRADDPQQFIERLQRLRAICTRALFDKPDPLDGPFFFLYRQDAERTCRQRADFCKPSVNLCALGVFAVNYQASSETGRSAICFARSFRRHFLFGPGAPLAGAAGA